MAWIKMQTNLFEHPKVVQIAALCGIDELHVVGCLHRLWSWADGQTENGNVNGVTLSYIDRKINVTGFAESMINVGWLHGDDGDLTLTNFEKHNGSSAKKRAETAKRVASHRSRACNADSVTGTLQPRYLEKIREEKSTSSCWGDVDFSFDDCISYADEFGIDIEFAKELYRELELKEFKTARGEPIKNPPLYLKKAWNRSRKSNSGNGSNSGPRAPWQIEKDLEILKNRKEKLSASIVAKQKNKTEIESLKVKIKNLEKEMAQAS